MVKKWLADLEKKEELVDDVELMRLIMEDEFTAK